MKQFNLTVINKAEIWLASIMLAIAVFGLLNAMADPYMAKDFNGYDFTSQGTEYGSKHFQYSFMSNYFLPWLSRYLTLYGSYLLLHFVIVKNLLIKKETVKNILLGVALFVLTVIIWGIAGTWIKGYLRYTERDEQFMYVRTFYQSFLTVFWLYTVYIVYILVKNNFLFILDKLRVKDEQPKIIRDCVVLLIGWAIILYLLNLPGLPDDYRIIWVIIIFPAIPVYAYASIRLIPLVKSKSKGFWNYLLRLIIIAGFFVLFICILYGVMIDWHNLRSFFLLTFLAVSFHPLIVGPITWLIYNARLSKAQEITGLKTALGQSSANFDFLRSQINPHFLFNVLNTLYGTALQENAERTGEGIQKLGDMMRFMLQENVQEQISLMREVDYLKNYIALQKLRTQSSADIVIKTEIEESINGLQIAPMLLIPFVENAFKHGISLREPSHINITLHTEGTKLLFDVYNSIRPKAENDPEKNKSGIGLENVKQRLQLLYPDRHELIIRESAKEFFIHLTIQLG